MNQLRRLAAGGRSTHTSGSGGSESAAIGVFSCFGAPPAGATAASWPGGPAGAATSLAAAGNASMSGGLGDGFLDWFNGAASAALGLDWLSSEIGATHAEEESALAPVQTTLSTRRRGGGRTGRRTRPPVQTSTPAVDTEARSETADNDMDDSGSDEDDDGCKIKALRVLQSAQNNILCTALLLSKYYLTYLHKNEPRIAGQTGYAKVLEILQTPNGSHKMFRMQTAVFYSLHELLVSTYGLKSSIHMNSIEALAMFLMACGHGWSNGATQYVFNHSGETISRKFEEVLHCMVAMCEDYIRPIDPNFSTTHPRISNDRRMMPFFKDCIGALDGTHISSTPPSYDAIRYFGRSRKATQNVLVVVDFDLRFTYASIGQPGSMHDISVLFHALTKDQDKFPHPPQGKYYHVDAGHPNRLGYLSPYKGERYHIPDWRRGPSPSGQQELFNHLHSSIRNAV